MEASKLTPEHIGCKIYIGTGHFTRSSGHSGEEFILGPFQVVQVDENTFTCKIGDQKITYKKTKTIYFETNSSEKTAEIIVEKAVMEPSVNTKESIQRLLEGSKHDPLYTPIADVYKEILVTHRQLANHEIIKKGDQVGYLNQLAKVTAHDIGFVVADMGNLEISDFEKGEVEQLEIPVFFRKKPGRTKKIV
jgi:hypothetical protein